MTEPTVPAATSIGHVHLKVADLERAVRFYCDVMGVELVCHLVSAVFVSAGGYHHRIGLNTWESKDGQPPAPGTTGLYHFAINYPTRRDLARAYKRLLDHPLTRPCTCTTPISTASNWPGTASRATGADGMGLPRRICRC